MEQARQYVGIDLHRRCSVIVRRNDVGETLDTVRIDNDPEALAAELAKAGEHPEVILGATYGWYWAIDVVQACGGNIHLAHPLGNNWGNRRRSRTICKSLSSVISSLPSRQPPCPSHDAVAAKFHRSEGGPLRLPSVRLGSNG